MLHGYITLLLRGIVSISILLSFSKGFCTYFYFLIMAGIFLFKFQETQYKIKLHQQKTNVLANCFPSIFYFLFLFIDGNFTLASTLYALNWENFLKKRQVLMYLEQGVEYR